MLLEEVVPNNLGGEHEDLLAFFGIGHDFRVENNIDNFAGHPIFVISFLHCAHAHWDSEPRLIFEVQK